MGNSLKRRAVGETVLKWSDVVVAKDRVGAVPSPSIYIVNSSNCAEKSVSLFNLRLVL